MPVREDTRPRASSPSTRPASGKLATEEQRRMAEITSYDSAAPDLQERARRVIEVTRCTEEEAYVALHDSHFNAELAVNNVLNAPKDVWVTTAGKSKKASKSDSTNGRRGGGMNGTGPNRGSFRSRNEGSAAESNSESRERQHQQPGRTGRPARGADRSSDRGSDRAESAQKSSRAGMEFRQRSDSSRGGQGSGGSSNRGRGGSFTSRGGMTRSSSGGRYTNGQGPVSKKPEVRDSEPVEKEAPVVLKIKLDDLAKELPVPTLPSPEVAEPEPEQVKSPVINLVNVPSHVVVIPDDSEHSEHFGTFPRNKSLPALGVCRIRRSQIPTEAVVMPPLPSSTSCGLQFMEQQIYSMSGRQMPPSPGVSDACVATSPSAASVSEHLSSSRLHSRGHSRSHSSASSTGGIDTQAPVLAHYSTENEVASAVCQPTVQDHPAAAAAAVLLRAASPQPAAVQETAETSFASLSESSRNILQQASLASSQQQQQQQQHMLMQQQQHLHSISPPLQHTNVAPNQLPSQPSSSQQVAEQPVPTPTSVLLRNPSQHNTSTVTASDSAAPAVTSATDVQPSVGNGAELSQPAAPAAVDVPFSRPLPPGVSTTNQQERTIQDSRSAAINAAASLASAAAASSSEPQQASRAQSGSKSGPGMYMPSNPGYMAPPQYMHIMPPYSEYDNGPQSRSRMNGIHDGPVQTTYQGTSNEQSASSSGVLGPAPTGTMNMMQQQPQQQQQQQQQQQPMHPYYGNMYPIVYPQVQFPAGPVPPFAAYPRSHAYNTPPYLAGHPGYSAVGLPGYDEEASAYQGAAGQGGQVKGGNNNTAAMTSVSSASVSSDSFKGQNFETKNMYGAGPYSLPAGVQQTYMHSGANNPAAAAAAAMMGRNMPPQVQPGTATHYSQHGIHPSMMDGMQQSVRNTGSQGGMANTNKHHQNNSGKYSSNHAAYSTNNWQ